jgi:hypothetical protein
MLSDYKDRCNGIDKRVDDIKLWGVSPACLNMARLCQVPYMGRMATLTKSNSVAALVDAVPTFDAGTGRFSIGLTSKETGVTYHLHLSETEAQRFAAFVGERIELTALPYMR